MGAQYSARVAAPGGLGPAEALVEVFGVFAQGGFDGGFVAVLDLELPVVRDHPVRDEFVVVGVEGPVGAAEEVEEFVGEGVDEGVGLQDRGAVRGRAARDGGDAAVQGVGGGLVEVAALEPEAAEEIEEARAEEHPEVCGEGGGQRCGASYALAGADAAYLGVFKRGDYVRQQSGLPEDVIIAENCDDRGYLGGNQWSVTSSLEVTAVEAW